MSSHLSYFKVENFKRFKSLELKNLGQINLIVGDNSVGKTSVLEALLFSEYKTDFLKNLHRTLCLREIHIHNYPDPFTGNQRFIDENYLKYIFDPEKVLSFRYQNGKYNKKKEIKLKVVTFDELKKSGKIKKIKYDLSKNQSKYWSEFQLNNSSPEIDFLYLDEQLHRQRLMPFIPCQKSYDSDLPAYYSDLVKRGKKSKHRLIQNLKLFAPKIEDIESLDLIDDRNHIMAYLEDRDSAIPIASMGEGINRLLRIMLQMEMERNNRLMIDEIDAGVYYKRFKDFWKAILISAKNSNVQVFATTHNYEALKYFNEALCDDSMSDLRKKVRHIKLTESPEGIVKPFVYNFEQFNEAMKLENPLR